MLVSIIIPHFNRSILLKETINSVLAQTFNEWEIIIVDDGSDDTELVKIKQYENEKNIKVIQRDGGIKGPSCCRNQGVKKAEGKYLLFLDSDDLLAPFCLEQRVSTMEEDEQTDMAVFLMTNFIKYPGDTNANFNIDAPFEKLTGLFLSNNNPWQTMAPIWKKNFFEGTGGFDEEMLFMEDPEIHLRIININKAHLKICYNKPADCYYRINNIDNTKKDFYYNSIFYRILFYRKVLFEKYTDSFITQNAASLKIGIYRLIKTFLYSRKNQFPILYNDLINLIKNSNLFSSLSVFWLTLLIDIGNKESRLFKQLRLRGICYKLLPVK